MSSIKRGSIIYIEKPRFRQKQGLAGCYPEQGRYWIRQQLPKRETIAIELKKITKYYHNQKVKTRQVAHVRGEQMAFESKWWTLLFAKLVVTNFTLGIGVAVKLLIDS
jgi:hypothetical protein